MLQIMGNSIATNNAMINGPAIEAVITASGIKTLTIRIIIDTENIINQPKLSL